MGYKYSININAMAAIENKFDLDYIDLILFDMIKDFANSNGCLKVIIDGQSYFWISHKMIIQQLPLLGIKSSSGIRKRISKLIDCNILEKSEKSEIEGKSLYKFGVNYDKMIYAKKEQKDSVTKKTPPGNLSHPPRTKVSPPQDESATYNSTIYNNTINNNNKGEVDLFFKSDLFSEKWNEWKIYRFKEFKAKFKSPISENAMIKKLVRISDKNEEKAIKIIEQSFENGWKGLFELNEKTKNNGNYKNNGNSNGKLSGRATLGSNEDYFEFTRDI